MASSRRTRMTVACVTLMRAFFCCPRERWMDATTDAPAPNIMAKLVLSRNSGAVILTAARASLPIPFPTKIPSVMMNAVENSIPSSVGISIFQKIPEIFIFPKSIVAFIDCLFLYSGCKGSAFSVFCFRLSLFL